MKKLIFAVICAALTTSTFAEKTAGFQLSLTPDVAIQDRNTRIKGVAINIWGENPMSGVQFGFVNGSTGDSAGLSFAWWLPCFLNYAENYKGVHWGWVNNTSGSFTGWQSGLVNISSDFVGFQSGLVSISKETMTGLQWSVVNYASRTHGVQLGLVNYAKTVDEWAFQLGLVNIIEDNPWFSNFPSELAQGMVIANWSFGGN